MSCITYLHNDPFDSGSKFISGTTCNGSSLSQNLFFGDSQCFESDEPLIICDGLTISGSCDSPVVTPTPSITASPTPTLTPTQTPSNTPNPVCPEEFIVTNSSSGFFDNGIYTRQYLSSGQTFQFGYAIQNNQNSGTIILGTAPDGKNYPIFQYPNGGDINTVYYMAQGGLPTGWRTMEQNPDILSSGSTWIGGSTNLFLTSNSIEFDGVFYPQSGQNLRGYITYSFICPTPTPTGTPTQTQTPTGTSSGTTPTPTPTPTPTQTPGIEIFTHGTVLATCSDYCNANYQIDVSTPADANFSTLTIGDTIFGQGGVAGFVAYAATSTDTSTGTFRIAEIDSSGEITGIFICAGGSCTPL